MNQLLNNDFFKSQIFSLVSDRDCPAIEKATQHGVRADIIRQPGKAAFSDHLLNYLQQHDIDYVISFFTKLFVGQLVETYQDRIINLHPSLLPSFKGLDGFGDTVRYGARYLGTTIHFIDAAMDEGKIIMQTAWPLDTTQPEFALRHRIFQQQCKSLLQVVKWLDDRRVQVQDNRVLVQQARFDSFEYSPALDFDDAIRLEIPLPSSLA